MPSTATEKQIHYARDIARILNIPLPPDETIESLGTFIATNCEEYHIQKKKKKKPQKEKYVVQEVDARIRLQNIKQRLSSEPLTNPKAIIQFMQQQMKNLASEAAYVINLDAKCNVINFCKVAIGSINCCHVPGREVFKTSILSNAASILLFHNHPSGDATPSKDDEGITDTLMKSGELLGIPLTDHIIVGINNNYYSFKEENHKLYQKLYQDE